MQFEYPELYVPKVIPNIPNLSLNFFVNQSSMMVVFLIFLVVYLIISGVLFYHWNTYGMRSRAVTLAQLIFFAGSCVVFGIAGMSVYNF